jgi:DNA-binding transcriptional LysR family regulator
LSTAGCLAQTAASYWSIQRALRANVKYEHVGLPPATAVDSMLLRAAARTGRILTYRVGVSNFDAALRVVEADIGISVIPRQIATRHDREKRLHVISLSDSWARRRFAVCFRDLEALQTPARQLLEYLASRTDG